MYIYFSFQKIQLLHTGYHDLNKKKTFEKGQRTFKRMKYKLVIHIL